MHCLCLCRLFFLLVWLPPAGSEAIPATHSSFGQVRDLFGVHTRKRPEVI